ncbi:hypothetical protein RJ55_04335 [Drechmeria coniospora]|nr:hypothetical protein RJ55_04335 [Drechmeria coniospora]
MRQIIEPNEAHQDGRRDDFVAGHHCRIRSRIRRRASRAARPTSCSLSYALPFALLWFLTLAVMGVAAATAASGPEPPRRPRALVYRGSSTSRGLPEAVAQLLESSPRNFEVRFAGPDEAVDVTAESLSAVELYAQPGGPDLDDAWAETKAYASDIRDFVSRGGRYLGFCLGAYLAGRGPGFGLLPRGADTDSEHEQKGAQVKDDKDTIIQVDWTFAGATQAGRKVKNRWLYFQEGAVIQGLEESDTSYVLGRYSKSGGVASSLSKYGDGWVGLIGPHPEATEAWFSAYNIDSPDGLQYEIGYDLIEATMEGGKNAVSAASSSGAAKLRSPLGRLLRPWK